MNHYDTAALRPCAANYAPLTPLVFLERAASVYPEQLALIDGTRRYTWGQLYARCCRLASALHQHGIGNSATVSIIAPNTHAIYEASFGVAMAGAVLNPINIRLDAKTIAFILEHSEAKVVLLDLALAGVVGEALATLKSRPYVITISTAGEGGDPPTAPSAEHLGDIAYEDFLCRGDAGFEWQRVDDEWRAISLNYTSGTTGNPKGVIYHHRGAYLNAIGNILAWNLPHHPTYLWTLPMFHCNGWCFPWTLAAIAGTSVCLPKVSSETLAQALKDHRITHFCGAPIVLQMALQATRGKPLSQRVAVMTAAAPPPTAVLEAMAAAGFDVTHVYGLTETYGPATLCAWKPQWNALPIDQQAAYKARQGVRYHVLDGLEVMHPETMLPVARDGKTLGEVMLRGNIVMKGYLKNPDATAEAFRDGWFHSGDVAVMHPDGYLQIKDRSKDIIISGGENISSIEIEDVLHHHPAVLDAAVVAHADDYWGETPYAFIDLKSTAVAISAQELSDFCRQHLASYKIPRRFIFGALPKTSTGKIQKFVLRERAQKDAD